MLEKERHTRTKYSNNSDISYTMEDLRLGAKGNISMLEPGRRIKLILGEPGVSNFFYNCMLLDAKPDSGQFVYPYGVFIVPQVSLFLQCILYCSTRYSRYCVSYLSFYRQLDILLSFVQDYEDNLALIIRELS